MVIRGFKDDSLKATVKAAEKNLRLYRRYADSSWTLRPLRYTEVPVTVIARNGEDGLDSCAVNSELGVCTEHAAVKGDVSLYAALEHLIHESKRQKTFRYCKCEISRSGRQKMKYSVIILSLLCLYQTAHAEDFGQYASELGGSLGSGTVQ